jgi:predicted metal-dependent hydrolase
MNISGIEIDVIKKNIKHLHIIVIPPNGDVRISAPFSASDDTIRLFAISKIAWIREQAAKYRNQLRQSVREYVSGESHYLWGKRYRLEVKYTNGNNSVIPRGNKIILLIHSDSTQKNRDSTMKNWYRKQLRSKLPLLFEAWEKRIGVHADDIKIKDMLTKWGTCSIKAKRIWINLQLVKKPPECLEYIVVHELIHLKEKAHNNHFIALMDEFLPDWRDRKEILNDFIMDQYVSNNEKTKNGECNYG